LSATLQEPDVRRQRHAPARHPWRCRAARHDNQFVTFSVAGEMFAVPMAPVQEIIRVPEVARLPLAPRRWTA
jgi:hypothetical protein